MKTGQIMKLPAHSASCCIVRQYVAHLQPILNRQDSAMQPSNSGTNLCVDVRLNQRCGLDPYTTTHRLCGAEANQATVLVAARTAMPAHTHTHCHSGHKASRSAPQRVAADARAYKGLPPPAVDFRWRAVTQAAYCLACVCMQLVYVNMQLRQLKYAC
jgi:hypothetical protein